MIDGDYLGDGLTRALRDGPSALPDNLETLVRHLLMLEGLLAEKAVEIEPTWALSLASAAEIDVLLQLQELIVERAIGLRAEAIEGVLANLTIWRTLSDGAEGEISAGAPPRLNRLVLSIEADLVRLRRGAARRRR